MIKINIFSESGQKIHSLDYELGTKRCPVILFENTYFQYESEHKEDGVVTIAYYPANVVTVYPNPPIPASE